MSKFLGLSKENCEVFAVEEVERPLTCPDCIPDLSAPKIDWLGQKKPYFDPRTCEYIINYLAPDKALSVKGPLVEYVRKVKPHGARELLKHYNKQNFDDMDNPNSSGYKKIKTSIKNVFIDKSNLIRIRIAINAVDFQKLPDRVIDPNDETPPDNTALDLPTNIVIDDSSGEFNINLSTVLVGLRGYQLKEETLIATQGGLVRRKNEEEFIVFKYSKFIDNIKNFRDKLYEFLSENGYKFLSLSSYITFDKTISNLRIELDNSNETNPLKINKVFVLSEGCPEKELKIGLDDFKQNAYIPEAIYFFANFNSIYSGITAEVTKNWRDFTDEYIYPPVFIDLGESPEDNVLDKEIIGTNTTCPDIKIPIGSVLENVLKDMAFGVSDLFSLTMDRNSCSQDPRKSNPTVKQFINPIKQREFEKLYKKALEEKKKQLSPLIERYSEPVIKESNETEEDFQKRKQFAEEKKKRLFDQIDRQAQEEAERLLEEDIKESAKTDPDKYNPLVDQWKSASAAKFNSDNSIFEMWKAIDDSDDIVGELTKFENYINLIGLCGINKGMKAALDCVFKQVTFDDVMKAMMKAFLGSIPPDTGEIWLLGIPPVKQIEIRNKIAKKFGTNLENVKWPWEMGQNNKEIAKQNTQREAIKKQYVADLEEDIKNGDEEAIELYEKEKEKQTKIFEKSNIVIPESDILNVKQAEEYIEENTYEALAEKQANKQLARRETDIADDFNEIAGDIVNAYVEVIFELFSIDDLLELFKTSPLIGFLLQFSQSFIDCPTKILQDLEQNKIKEFKLDICNPTTPIGNFKIPQIEFSTSPLKIVSKNITKVIRETIMRVISRLVRYILNLIEDTLCKLAELAGKAVLRPDEFFGDFGGTLKKAFCPNSSDDQANNIANNLLNKIGLKDDDISSAVDCLGGALTGSFTQDELISLMLDENPSPSLLDRVSDAVKIGCPKFSDLFADRDAVKNIFNRLRDLIPEQARQRLRDLASVPTNLPLYETICLTSEELELWDNLRRGNLEAAGLSPEDARQQVENYNQRARDALEDLLNSLSGPEDLLADALNDLFASNPEKPPGCDLKEGESNFGSKALKEPKDLVLMQDEISNTMLNTIGDSFDREFCANANPFRPSLIHRIMRDTRGNDYGGHNFRESFPFTRMDYHHSLGSQQIKTDAPWYTKFFGVDNLFGQEDRGYFPETIGKELQNQATVISTYETKEDDIPNFFSPAEYSVIFNADYLYSNGSYGEVGYYSDIDGQGDRIMDYQLSSETFSSEKKIFTENVNIEQDVKEILDGFNLSSNKKKRQAFRLFIEDKMSGLSVKPNLNYDLLFDKTCEKIFNSTQILVFEDSPGLIFGYEDEDLTEVQLKYVGPNGEEPYENYFSEEDKTLGRAKEETDRVFFLPPEQYGGTYTRPPVYIKPKAKNGWLKISKTISPQPSACPPEAESILKFSEIKQHANNVRNSSNYDKRLKTSVDNCFLEKPFDKILSKNAIGAVDAISRIHVRMAIAKVLTKTIPAIGNVKYSDVNYGNVITDLIYDEMIKDLTNIDPFWPTDKKNHIYAMLVLEQLVQSYEREIIKPLPSGSVGGKDLSSLTSIEQEAYTNIISTKENYTFNSVSLESGAIKNLPPINTLTNPLLNTDFAVYGVAYKKFGESIFNDDFAFNWNGLLGLASVALDYRLFSKALAIRLTIDSVKVLVKKIINIEFKKMTDNFYNNFEPKIENLMEYFITSNILFYNNNLKSFGTTDYYNKSKLGSLPNLGEAADVSSDVANKTPWEEAPKDEMLFKIEKYIRFVKKETGGPDILDEEIRFGTTERDYLGSRGIQSLEEAQDFIEAIKEQYGEYYMSELFGDAELSDDENSYTGHIGISYGIRIILKAPQSSFGNESLSISENDLTISNREKAFYCKNLERRRDLLDSNNFSIPIVSREIEFKDKQIKDINFISGDDSYDLNCIVKKLVDSTEYRMLFKYLCPIKSASSMMLLYSNNFFVESIGMDDGWDNDGASAIERKKDLLGNWDHVSGVELKDTEAMCRKYFASFYDSTKFINNENFKLPKIELPDLFDMLFGKIQLPQLDLAVQLPNFAFDHKIIKENPLDGNEEVCKNPEDKFFE